MLNDLLENISKMFPSQKVNMLVDSREQEIFETLLNVIGDKYGMDAFDIACCYEIFVKDMLEESKYFFEHNSYRCSTFHEAGRYMASKGEHYMLSFQIGLLVSSFLWPHRNEMHTHFLNFIKAGTGSNYLEIGVGHGFYFGLAVENSLYDTYLGIDINEDCIQMAKAVVECFPASHNKQYTLKCKDFLRMCSGSTYDAIISGEVLEHIENPGAFLLKIAEMAHDKTLIYVTTVMNAPIVDHISLFRNPDELRSMFVNNGLSIIDMKFFLYKNKPLENCIQKKWPVTVAIIAKKQSVQ